MAAKAQSRLWALGLGAGLGLTGLLLGAGRAAAQVTGAAGARSLGTVVNGVKDGSCNAGLCGVSGGTGAGSNLFHRFGAFDTRGGITGVRIESAGYSNVMVGVINSLGSFIDKPVALSGKGNLFWLSPGGITISGSGGFQNVQHLNLSTATGLRIGSGLFDVLGTTPAQAALLSGEPLRGRSGLVTDPASLAALGLISNGDLSIDGGTLTVDQSLLMDAQGGNVLLQVARLLVSGGEIEVAGRDVSISASELYVSSPDGVGGRIAVEGESVSVRHSRLDASGATGGGNVRIGGGIRGEDPTIRNASSLTADSNTTITADAIGAGNGGEVILYAKDNASLDAQLSARGGGESGDGGFIETSAGLLSVSKAPDISAPNGEAGTWLIDPFNIEIVGPAAISGGDPITTGESPFTGVGDGVPTSKLDVTLLEQALDAGGTVIVDTTDTPGNSGTGAGDISVLAPITTTAGGAGASLELRAHNDIHLNAAITSTGNRLDVDFVSDQDNNGAGSLRWGSVRLDLQGGSATARDMTITPGAAAVLAAGSALEAGSLMLSSGSLTLDGPAVFSEELTIAGGTLTGAGDVTLPGGFTWSGGTISGTGGLTVDG
ncbi:MAG: hypothetical protein QUV07_01755, partial [Cyanobium sp. CZS 25K]|nr:hypothetical protein [Cyanobium sp. CZS25K]